MKVRLVFPNPREWRAHVPPIPYTMISSVDETGKPVVVMDAHSWARRVGEMPIEAVTPEDIRRALEVPPGVVVPVYITEVRQSPQNWKVGIEFPPWLIHWYESTLANLTEHDLEDAELEARLRSDSTISA